MQDSALVLPLQQPAKATRRPPNRARFEQQVFQIVAFGIFCSCSVLCVRKRGKFYEPNDPSSPAGEAGCKARMRMSQSPADSVRCSAWLGLCGFLFEVKRKCRIIDHRLMIAQDILPEDRADGVSPLHHQLLVGVGQIDREYAIGPD